MPKIQNIEDTYPAVDSAISLLKDNHRYYKPIIENEQYEDRKSLPLLLDETTPIDTIGYFVDSDNNYDAWILTDGKVFIENQHIYSNKDYTFLDLTDSRVAVLIDYKTASSGEATAVALKGRNKTKLFGEPTYGVSTGCVSHTLSNGSIIPNDSMWGLIFIGSSLGYVKESP